MGPGQTECYTTAALCRTGRGSRVCQPRGSNTIGTLLAAKGEEDNDQPVKLEDMLKKKRGGGCNCIQSNSKSKGTSNDFFKVKIFELAERPASSLHFIENCK